MQASPSLGSACDPRRIGVSLFVVMALACENRVAESRGPAPAPMPASSNIVLDAQRSRPSAGASSADATVDAAPTPTAAAALPWPPAPPDIASDFCIDTVHALDEETCYVLPDAPPSELLVYLHGIVPPSRVSAQKTNLETVIRNAAQRAGVAALIPRGRRGLAPKGRETWWGWPTGAATYEAHAAELVQSIERKRERLEALANLRFERVYLAGSSSGAYFVAALALRGGFQADGYGAFSGGGPGPLSRIDEQRPTPFYVGYGRYDDSVRASANALAALLRDANWPVLLAVHPVPHGAREVYLDEAIAFWRRPITARDVQ